VAYVSLYRRYRPQSFAEVVGQRHVTETLANAITEDRLHHAYLFTGPRGTGKTSTARILAKAINCEEGPTAEPCQVCDICVSITDGSAVDVIELDMASHGGVDDARELRERALFAPARVRRKVYILDEVHMASNAAFNALLKLIEEPPGHVIFAMATTDPQKVLPTIMSRVQRLDLRRVAGAEVSEHVRRIAALEEVEIEDAAVDAIVRAGDGSVRDTLSVLEQVLAFAGASITVDHVAELLGHTPAERVFDSVSLLAVGDLGGSLSLVDDLIRDGIDPRRFALDLVAHLRDLLVLQTVPDRPDLVDASADHRTRLLGQAPSLSRERLVDAIDVLGETLADMRRGPARLPLELALAKLTLAAPGSQTAPVPAVAAPGSASGAVDEDVAPSGPQTVDPEELEAVDAPAPSPTSDGPPQTEAPAPIEAAGETAPPAASARAADEVVPEAGTSDEVGADAGTSDDVDLDAVRLRWQQVLDVVKRASPRVHAIVAPATPSALEGRALVLAYPQRYAQFHAEQVERDENAAPVVAAVAQVLGAEVVIRSRVLDDPAAPPSASPPSQVVAEEEVEVREAEIDPPTIDDPAEAAERAAALLREELGARAVDEGGGP
jgi:DNA polymerase III subunit gamma/tau